MAYFRLSGFMIVGLLMGLTSSGHEPGPGVLQEEKPARRIDLDKCIYFIIVELVPPREPLPEGAKFHLPNYVRAKVGDLLSLNARENATEEIIGIDAQIEGVALERVGVACYATVGPNGNAIATPSPPRLLLRTIKTGKATVEAVVSYEGGRTEKRKIEVEVLEKRELPKE